MIPPFIIQSIKFCTPIPSTGNPFSTPEVSCLWYIQEAHGCLLRALQRKSILSARRNHPPPSLMQPWLHCRAAGSPSNSLAKRSASMAKVHATKSWGYWGQLATKAGILVLSLFHEESPLNLRFTANLAVVSESARRMRTLFPASSTSDASDTSFKDL